MNPLNHFKEFLTQAHCYITLSIRLRIIPPVTLIARKPEKPYLACLHAALWACVLSLRWSPTLRDPADVSPSDSSVHGSLQARNCGGFRALLQGIFPAQGLSPRLLLLRQWQAGSLPLAPPGKPFMWPYMRSEPAQQPLLVTFSFFFFWPIFFFFFFCSEFFHCIDWKWFHSTWQQVLLYPDLRIPPNTTGAADRCKSSEDLYYKLSRDPLHTSAKEPPVKAANHFYTV